MDETRTETTKADEAKEVVEVPYYAPLPDGGTREGAFLAITAWSPLYKDYDDPSMTDAYRAALFPVVLMVLRWDGRLGFPGGLREGDNTLPGTALKEALEEVGFVAPREQVRHVASHQGRALRVHLFHHPLGIVTRRRLAGVLAAAAAAEHCVVEGSAVWVPLLEYRPGKGFGAVRTSGMLAMAVGEELDLVRKKVLAWAPPGAFKG